MEEKVNESLGLQNKYIKLEKDKTVFLKITNWRTIVNPFVNPNNQAYVWKCDVKAEGDTVFTLAQYMDTLPTLTIGNVKSRKAINDFLKDKNPNDVINMQITRMGENKSSYHAIASF